MAVLMFQGTDPPSFYRDPFPSKHEWMTMRHKLGMTSMHIRQKKSIK